MEVIYSNPILPDMEVIQEIKNSWIEFDKVKDTLEVKEFDMSDNNEYLLALDDYKACKELEDKAKLETEKAKKHLLTFYQGAKTTGGGATISKVKDSVSVNYSKIYKDNKELLKNVDLSKYEQTKKGSFRITLSKD